MVRMITLRTTRIEDFKKEECQIFIGIFMSLIKHIFNKDSLNDVRSEDLQMLIQNKTEEFLYLDYEAIPENNVSFDGLARHVSGFLNSSGGIIVFGIREKQEGQHKIPGEITWNSLITKETVERSLFAKIQPWNEDIQIIPITNPKDAKQRIFLISVPKSKNPPHMANHKYYIRLNFEAQEMGHDQVLALMRQTHIQKSELISSVYEPIFNELSSHYNMRRMETLSVSRYEEVRRNKAFVLFQDSDLNIELDEFYQRVYDWNKALNPARSRTSKLIRELATKFFKELLVSPGSRFSVVSVYMDIRAESTNQLPTINEAVLNGQDPVEFWKLDYPHDTISEIQFSLTCINEQHIETKLIVPETGFRSFIKQLQLEIAQDRLIKYVREVFDELQCDAENLMDSIGERMK